MVRDFWELLYVAVPLALRPAGAGFQPVPTDQHSPHEVASGQRGNLSLIQIKLLTGTL